METSKSLLFDSFPRSAWERNIGTLYFDPVATGFHLKEYSVGEMRTLLEKADFSKVRTYIGAKGVFLRFPILPLVLCEKLLETLPRSPCRKIAKSRAVASAFERAVRGRKMSDMRAEGFFSLAGSGSLPAIQPRG